MLLSNKKAAEVYDKRSIGDPTMFVAVTQSIRTHDIKMRWRETKSIDL